MSLRLPYDQTSEKAFARDIAKAEARIDTLEAHLRRVLEAGDSLAHHTRRPIGMVNDWDRAASDAEGVLRG